MTATQAADLGKEIAVGGDDMSVGAVGADVLGVEADIACETPVIPAAVLADINLADVGHIAHVAPTESDIVRDDIAIFLHFVTGDTEDFGGNVICSLRGESGVANHDGVGNGGDLDGVIGSHRT